MGTQSGGRAGVFGGSRRGLFRVVFAVEEAAVFGCFLEGKTGGFWGVWQGVFYTQNSLWITCG